jgi:Fe2+ or Zn2+ uptake regulation protein
VTVKCNHCGGESSLTEHETSQIARDLDEQYTLEEQANLTFSGVCSDCWRQQAPAIIARARAGARRVILVRATAF